MTEEEMLEDAQAVFDLYKQHIDPIQLRKFMLNKVMWNFLEKGVGKGDTPPALSEYPEGSASRRIVKHYFETKLRRAKCDERRTYWQSQLTN